MSTEKEYDEYYIYTLEQFLIETQGYDDFDAWIRVMQEPKKVKVEYDALSEIVQSVGPDRRALISECEKLAIYVGDRGVATVIE